MLKFRASAFKHGVKADQIREVLADKWGMTKWFHIHEDSKGNSQDMVVGFDAEGSLLEIGIVYLEDDEIVFHADSATPAWVDQYNGS